MEWILVLTMNATAGADVTQSPAMIPGFTTKERCEAASEKISTQLIVQGGKIKESRGEHRNQNPPYIWADCILITR